MKLPYAPWRVRQRPRWHKFVFFGCDRIEAAEKLLTGCSGDYMSRRNARTSRRAASLVALVASDEDFVLLKMGMNLSEDEYRGYYDWANHHPVDTRTSSWSIPRTTRHPVPMSIR